MTHSKGPWHVVYVSGNAGYTVITDDEGRNIASMSDRLPDRVAANARLLAAAPDLLNAMGALLAFLEQYPHQYPVDIGGFIADGEAAIAKAENQ